jgi:hypothetical protein
MEKVPLNCTSAIKSLLHASLNSLSTIVQKVSVYCIFHFSFIENAVVLKSEAGNVLHFFLLTREILVWKF